jgi:hypothetical protein
VSAGAGRVGRTRGSDFYPSTPAVALALVAWWRARVPELPGHVIDPCAGVGCLLDAWAGPFSAGAQAQGEAVAGPLTWGVERDEALAEVVRQRHPGVVLGDGLHGDYRGSLAYDPPMTGAELPGAGELVVLNPPFSDCDAWVRAAVEYRQRRGADVAILLRSQWIDDGQTKGRAVYRYGMPPRAIVRLPWRVSFDGDGADSCTYAWHVWSSRRYLWQPWSQDAGGPSGVSTFWASPPGTIAPSPEAIEVWRRGAELSRGGQGQEQLDIFGG